MKKKILKIYNLSQKKKFIKKGTKSFNQVSIACFSAGFSNFAILYSIQPILPIFSKIFNLTPLQSSYSLSASTISMALCILCISPLSNRYSRKTVITISLIFGSLSTIICSFIYSWKWIIIMRIFTGISLSGVTGVALTYLNEEIHPKDLSFSIGLYISGNTIGGCLGRIATSILSNVFSWHTAMLVIGVLSLCNSIIFFYLLPDSKNYDFELLNINLLFKNFIQQLKNSILTKLFCIGFLLMGSFTTIFNYITYRLVNFPFFLDQKYMGLLSIIYLIGVYTSPLAGAKIEKNGRYIILNISLITMLIGLLITQLNIIRVILLGLTLFAGGFFGAHSILSSWISFQSRKKSIYASSLYLFFYYLGSSVLGTLGGYFWFFLNWFGVSIFVFVLLFLSILINMKLKKNNIN